MHSQSLEKYATAELYTIGSSPTSLLNYIYSPKNACSSIMASLLDSEENPHSRFDEVFLRGPVDVCKPIFCMTRNPYDRAISAYLDKVGPGKDNGVWNEFSTKYNLNPDSQPSFVEFLEILRGEEKPYTLDLHFRPQFYVNNYRFVRPKFVGRIERMHDVQRFLESYGFRFRAYRPHATGAASKRANLKRVEVDLIRDIYRLDFESYGYEQDYLVFEAPHSIEQEQSMSAEFEIAATFRGMDCDKILTLANDIFENGNQKIAQSMLAIAIVLDRNAQERAFELFPRMSIMQSKLNIQVDSMLLSDIAVNREVAIWLKEQLEPTEPQLLANKQTYAS